MAEVKPEQVSREVAMAAKRAFIYATGPRSIDDWHVAIAAAINAWPGMGMQQTDWERWKLPFPLIILPLTQENSDEQ